MRGAVSKLYAALRRIRLFALVARPKHVLLFASSLLAKLPSGKIRLSLQHGARAPGPRAARRAERCRRDHDRSHAKILVEQGWGHIRTHMRNLLVI